MRKRESIELSVPEPCQENWDKMTATEKGKHCGSCNKTVIDFSLYSDKELVKFFSQLNTHVCGRFSNYQVNRELSYSEPGRFSFLYKLFFGSVLASWFGLTPTASAANTQIPGTEQLAQNKMGHVASATTKHIVHGVVKEAKSGTHIPHAMVYIKEAPDCQTTSDSTGKFTLNIPDSLVGKQISLVASQPNYSPAETSFIASKFPLYKDLLFPAEPRMIPLMGAPVMRKPDTAK